MVSKIKSKFSIVIMKKRTRCEKIVEAPRQCKERFFYEFFICLEFHIFDVVFSNSF